MFICPQSGCRLVKARVKGGMFWYSPETDGRLLSLHTFKHFLGEHASSEIWMRSENSSPGKTDCPGCRRKMQEVQVPKWIGDHTVDVCRICWVIWLEANKYQEIPLGSDISKDVVEIQKRASIAEVQIQTEESSQESATPDSVIHSLPAFLSLPVKTISGRLPLKTLVVIVAALFMMKFLFFATTFDMMFYVVGFYFFYLFSSDIEMELGHITYIIFTLGSVAISLSLALWLGEDLHYLDLLAVIYSMMSLAVLFPIQAKYSYLIPFVHYFDLSSASGRTLRVADGFTFIRAKRWIRIPQWLVIFVYVAISIAVLKLNPSLKENVFFKYLVLMQIAWGILFRAILYIRKPYNQI